ncbi:arylsulfatase J-like [Oppia nitens]|uniref:arylsulfatase J-like n=1 Tax=Oppia nitens TaxID=1686743 RepID=UPI0023DA728C|nr:arylsulfatase J-like [Oppia nitens]
MELLTNQPQEYSTLVYTNKTIDIIRNHNINRPLFLYVAYQSLHASYADNILQAPPDSYMKRFAHIESQNRRTYAAMAYCMDESIGNIVGELYDRSMLSNSIIIFTSDNGPMAINIPNVFSNFGSDVPLRGVKTSLFEGGIRVPTFIWSPLLSTSSYQSDELIHVTDIMPTLLEAIGGIANNTQLNEFTNNTNSYGMSQWQTLSKRMGTKRSELLHNIDPVWNQSSIRWYNWKLVQGPSDPNLAYMLSQWYPTIPIDDSQRIDMNQSARDRLKHTDRLTSRSYRVLTAMHRPLPDYNLLETSAITNCQSVSSTTETDISGGGHQCQSDREFCLFNIRSDPCEHRNIASKNRHLVSYLWNRLQKLNQSAVWPLALTPGDQNGYPDRHGQAWVNWL